MKKRRGKNDYYGGVSILAVGDFYQLPPVGGEMLTSPGSIYAATYWTPHFNIVELTEIMRQKDDASFAKMLNRLRTRGS